MRNYRPIFAIVLAALILVLPGALAAAEPELLSQSTFGVTGDPSGKLEVTFALALSTIPSYFVTITAVSGSTEEQLWGGNLSEGFYRLRTQLTKIPGSGPLKVVVKTTMVNRTSKGSESFNVYRTWEGTLGR